MKFFHVILLDVIFILTISFTQDVEDKDDEDMSWFTELMIMQDEDDTDLSKLRVPNITVYRMIEDREQVIVICKPDTSGMRHPWWLKFTMFLEIHELNTTMEMTDCSRHMCLFQVTVSPPVSFTCVLKRDHSENASHSKIFSYGWSSDTNTSQEHLNVSDHPEGVSLVYICFSSIIAVGLIIMTVTVIVINIRSKDKDPINHSSATNNDYVDA